MEKILKDKAFKLYLNKISLEEFEDDLYKLVEYNKLKINTFFYDLVVLNYKDLNYRKNLFDLLKKNSLEEEMLSLQIYQKCISIINSKEQKEILLIIDELASLCYETEYNYDALFCFYRLSDGISLKSEGFYFMPFEDIINEAKLFSKKMVKKFDDFKVGEGWSDFLESLPNEISDVIVKKHSKKSVDKYVSKKVKPLKRWYEFWK